MLSGSDQLKQALQSYSDMDVAKKNAEQSKRTEGSLQVQALQNKGAADVATIRNTGAMQQEQAKIDAEKPLISAQSDYYNSHGNYFDSRAALEKAKGESDNNLTAAQANAENALARGRNSIADNQDFTNSLARQYAPDRMANEAKLQGYDVAKIGMQLDGMNEAWDTNHLDAGMQQDRDYQARVAAANAPAAPQQEALPTSYSELLQLARTTKVTPEERVAMLKKSLGALSGGVASTGLTETLGKAQPIIDIIKGAMPF